MQICGQCTLCCKLLEIKDVKSKPNEWCKYCTKKGCSIYVHRPQDCKEFRCAWLQMPYAGIEMRPDKCGVIFEKLSDRVMGGLTEGRMIPLVKGQIQAFNREMISVVLLNHSNRSKSYFLAPFHTKKFVEEEVDDSTQLHRGFNRHSNR